MIWDTLAFNDLDEMRRDIDALLEVAGANAAFPYSFPPLNAYESRDEFILIAVVPGIAKADLELQFEEDAVTFTGERGSPMEENPSGKFLRHEREHVRFSKTFRFPAGIARDGISAKLENGILVIRAPKTEESKPKQINIQA